MKKYFYFFIILIFGLSSCRVFNPSKMIRTGIDYKYTPLPKDSNQLYKIAPNDVLSFQIYTNDGERLIDPIGGFSANGGSGNMGGNVGNSGAAGGSNGGSVAGGMNTNSLYGGIPLLVEYDGTVKFPILGRMNMAGMTSREAETFLEEKFSVYFNKPFIRLGISNNRIFLIRGGTNSTIVPLYNARTTLFELIAGTGGIGDGKAHKIKLIRKTKDGNKVYLIDLSRVQNIDQGNMVLQANDVVYIEPRDRVPEQIMNTFTPYLSLLSTILLIYSVSLKK